MVTHSQMSPIEIATLNIENLTSNFKYLQYLCERYTFVCIQEHWLHKFQVPTLSALLPDADYAIKCCDEYDPASPMQRKRGTGGVAIIWKKKYSSKVTELPDGGNRVIAIQVAAVSQTITLICTYMPASNTHDPTADYQDVLDQIYEITSKYSTNGPVIWLGDINADPNRQKPTQNDKLFKRFCEETGYVIHPSTPMQATYHHFHGDIHSQIDHILALTGESIIQSVSIDAIHPLNTSPHDMVCAILTASITERPTPVNVSGVVPTKTKWNNVNTSKYQMLTEEKLDTLINTGGLDLPPELLVQRLNTLLMQASDESSIKPVQKAPRHKKKDRPWCATLKPLIKHSKMCFFKWKKMGRPTSPHSPLLIEMKEAKRCLRSAQRSLCAKDRRELQQEIMITESNDKQMFFKLVGRQRKNPCSAYPVEFPNPEDSQEEGWAQYFEGLATPASLPEFNEEFRQSAELQLALIPEANRLEKQDVSIHPLNVAKYIKSMKNGKAADIFGLTAEHLKHASPIITSVLSSLIQNIFRLRTIPESFKLGVITPVLKKGKPAKAPDSYRRITVSSVIGKVVEKEILTKTQEVLLPQQNGLQFGFTPGSSSTNCAFVISEAVAEAKTKNHPLYVTLLDAKKAFDVVWHPSLLVSLYHQGITGPTWDLYQEMYHGISSKVKVEGSLSRAFKELQGIRQGGGTSADLFKSRSNNLLNQLTVLPDAYKIGTISLGCPTTADDTMMLSKTRMGAQTQMIIAQEDANRHRYSFSEKKTKIIAVNLPIDHEVCTTTQPVLLNNKPVSYSNEETHLGLQRTKDCKMKSTCAERVKAGRRACYALMGAGMHGLNGVGPKVALRLWDIYVQPVLLHNLEATIYSESDIEPMEAYHKSILRQLQHLPTSTAIPALYLLTGQVPLSAQLHIKTLTFFVRLLHRDGSVEKELIHRQLAMKSLDENSWLSTVRKLLWSYNLPSAFEVARNPPRKEQWSRIVKNAVHSKHFDNLKREAETKKSLVYINLDACTEGEVHPIWNVSSSPEMVTMATVKTKMLVQRYPVTASSHAGKAKSDVCPLCAGSSETLSHFILQCTALDAVRKPYIEKICSTLDSLSYSLPEDTEDQLQMILDASAFNLPEDILYSLELMSQKMCFALHNERTIMMGGCSQYKLARGGKGPKIHN